ncbi:uncharacterized protein [Macrobrachium rosenbergii]|uniref:uncharacterized protein n=1 Tax=Macrobrachium rosenbergii TaxID=79674 RepID=UPI0034D74B0F
MMQVVWFGCYRGQAPLKRSDLGFGKVSRWNVPTTTARFCKPSVFLKFVFSNAGRQSAQIVGTALPTMVSSRIHQLIGGFPVLEDSQLKLLELHYHPWSHPGYLNRWEKQEIVPLMCTGFYAASSEGLRQDTFLAANKSIIENREPLNDRQTLHAVIEVPAHRMKKNSY